jgi:hypothetical protein
VNYETFLFTRNQQRDFTAFIRPKELTNKEISTIASALGNVNDVSELTADWPALYCFPIGEYILLMRHYDSGRKHAGRNIPLLEGIAVKRTRARHFAVALPHFLAHQADLLAIARKVPDIETQAVQKSPDLPWPDVQAEEAIEGAADDSLVNEFVARLTEDRLFIPFNADGRAMLIAALSDPRFPSLYFAFGTNSDVVARLNKADIDIDIVSYFNSTMPSLRSRATNEVTSELTGYVSSAPKSRPKPATLAKPTNTAKPDLPPDAPAPMRPLRETRAEPKKPHDEALKRYDTGEDAMLTPRQMARKAQEAEHQNEVESEKSESVLGWLGGLIARLLGRK